MSSSGGWKGDSRDVFFGMLKSTYGKSDDEDNVINRSKVRVYGETYRR